MPIYKTGRTATITFGGNLSMRRYVRSLVGSIGIEGEIPGIFKTSGAQFTAEFTWSPGITTKVSLVSGTGREEGWWAEAWSGLGAYASDDNRVVSADPPTDTEFDNSFSDGSYSISIEVEEYFSTEAMDPAEVATIDGTDFPAWPLTAAPQPDGLPATRGVCYLAAKIGGTVSATISGGGASATASDVIGSAFTVSLVGIATHGCGSTDTTGYCRHTADWYGASVVPEYARSVGGVVAASVSANGSQWNAETAPTADNTAGASLSVIAQPPTENFLDAQLRRIGTGPTVANASSLQIQWQDKAGAGQLLAGTSSVSGTGEQRFYTCGATLNTVTQSGVTVDELAPIRAHVTPESLGAAGEDSRDWRLMLQFWPCRLLDVAQTQERQVANSATLAADGTISLTETVWEGYRYLRVPYTLSSARTITLTHGAKSWTKALASGSGTWTIDLCAPHNLPGGFDTDHRDWRWPLENTATAPGVGGKPLWDTLSDEEKGWLFGPLERPTTVGVSGLSAGDSLTISGLYLRRESDARVGVLAPFRAETLAWEGQSGGEQTDSTYIDPDLWLWSDSKPVGPWPFRARVDPVSSSTPNYFNYFTLSLLETYIEGAPGWVATQVAQPVGFPVLLADGTTPILGSAVEAGALLPYIHDGTTWRDQTWLSLTAQLHGCLLVDELYAHPLMGDPRLGWNPVTNRDIPVRVSKVLRGRAEGFTFDGDGLPAVGESIRISRESDPTEIGGTATSAANGSYVTGTDYAKGNARYLTEHLARALSEAQTHANRLPRRTSFAIPPDPQQGCAAYDVSDGSRHFRAYTEGGTARFGKTDDAQGWTDSDTGFAADWLDVAVDRTRRSERVYLWTATGGSVYRRHTDDEGTTWTMPTTIASGRKPFGFVGRNGLTYEYWIAGTGPFSIRGRIVDRAGAVVVAEFQAVATCDDQGAAAGEYDLPGGGHRIVIYCVVGGSVTRYVSTDGVLFT